MEYGYDKCVCPHCGRKILVEKILVGVPHTVGVYATCLDCLMEKGMNEDFIKDNPQKAKDIQRWYDSSEQSEKNE